MITASALARLASSFRGTLITPDGPDYDSARKVFNGMIDRRPALIARCASADDVALAVTFARAEGTLVSVRCAGHNIAGYAVCDGGIVIDLSPMKGLSIDVDERTVRAEAGLNWGEVNDALQPHGLAATGGFVSVTGVSGLTLGGGMGWLVRKHGLAMDNLLSAEVVLADGCRVTASAQENPDLFWALRGGGGNFGIVTAFVFQTHPVGTALAGICLHPVTESARVLRRWRDFERTSPEELTEGALMFHLPEDFAGPPELRGAPVIGVGGVYAGALDEGVKVLAPMRAFGPPLVDSFQPTPYNEAQRMADFLWPNGLHNYWKSNYLRELSDEAIDVVAEFVARVPSKRTVVILEYYGNSAFGRVPDAATAFGHRAFPFNFLVTSAWTDAAETDRNIRWTRDFIDAMRPFAANAAYLNYIGEEGADGLKASYGTEKLRRLADLKRKFDPENLFRMNQNIQPAAAE